MPDLKHYFLGMGIKMLYQNHICSWVSRSLLALLLVAGPLALAQQKAPLAQLPTPSVDSEVRTILNSVVSKKDSLNNVIIHVDSGIVTLSGVAASPKDSEWLKEIAQRMPSVIAVIDKTSSTSANLSDLSPIWKELYSLAEKFKQYLPSLLIAFLFLALCYFLGGYFNRGVNSLWSRKILNPFLLTIVTRLTLLPIWIMLLYLVIKMLGLSALGTTLIGGTGLLGIVLGLSFKGIAENYLAGLLLATRSPFTRGDLIIIGQYKGYVQNLNMRGTTIIDFSGNLILIPNIMVIQSVVENQTANPKTRTQFNISISYNESISKAQALIIDALKEVQGVIADPAPSVIVSQFGSNRVELSIRVWFNVKDDREMRIRSRAMIHTKETLIANGFSVPNETRELTFVSPLKIENVKFTQDPKDASDARKAQAQKQATSNLNELEHAPSPYDPSSEDLLLQAEKNPLPLNVSQTDFLKK